MKIKYALWLMLGLSWLTQAADDNTTVYSWTDAQGVTHFGDKPINGNHVAIQKVEIINPPVNNPNPIVENTADAATAQATTTAYTLTISSPQNEQTFRNNSGQLTVQNQLSPALPNEEQTTLVLYIDANRHACDAASLSCAADNVERGTHQLHTELISQNGKILASSQPITVYLFRASAVK